jgi:hypothetical protein
MKENHRKAIEEKWRQAWQYRNGVTIIMAAKASESANNEKLMAASAVIMAIMAWRSSGGSIFISFGKGGNSEGIEKWREMAARRKSWRQPAKMAAPKMALAKISSAGGMNQPIIAAQWHRNIKR